MATASLSFSFHLGTWQNCLPSFRENVYLSKQNKEKKKEILQPKVLLIHQIKGKARDLEEDASDGSFVQQLLLPCSDPCCYEDLCVRQWASPPPLTASPTAIGWDISQVSGNGTSSLRFWRWLKRVCLQPGAGLRPSKPLLFHYWLRSRWHPSQLKRKWEPGGWQGREWRAAFCYN